MSRRSASAGLTFIAAAHVVHAGWRFFLIDDAYISFRYAGNLVNGLGLVYNAGERVEGYTNFLWTLLLALAIRLDADPARFAPIAGIAASALTLLVLYRWARLLGVGRAWSLVAPAMMAANRSFAAWATGGLETRLFTLLVVAAGWRLHAERMRPAARPPWSALLISLACLTRPDGGIALAAGGASLLMGRPLRVRRAALWLAWAAALPALHLAWRLHYYGSWVPNSFHAKVPGPRLASGAVYVGLFAWNHLLWMVPAALLVAGALRRGSLRPPDLLPLSRYALSFPAAYLAYTLIVGGDHFEFRFVDSVLVLLCLASATAAGLAAGGGAGVAARARGALSKTALAALLVLLAALPSLRGFHDVDLWLGSGDRRTYVSITSVETESALLDRWTRIGRWLGSHAARHESIALTPAGAIPYLSGLRALDMLGINDAEVARTPPRPGRNVGHERRVEADEAMRRGITYLIADPVIRSGPEEARPAGAAVVDFGSFRWYFWPLQATARLKPIRYSGEAVSSVSSPTS